MACGVADILACSQNPIVGCARKLATCAGIISMTCVDTQCERNEQEDRSSTPHDPAQCGRERLTFVADTWKGALDPAVHLRPGRHKEWTPTSGVQPSLLEEHSRISHIIDSKHAQSTLRTMIMSSLPSSTVLQRPHCSHCKHKVRNVQMQTFCLATGLLHASALCQAGLSHACYCILAEYMQSTTQAAHLRAVQMQAAMRTCTSVLPQIMPLTCRVWAGGPGSRACMGRQLAAAWNDARGC